MFSPLSTHGFCPPRVSVNALKILFQSIKIYMELLSRSLLRGAPDPGQAEKNSLEEVVELRTGTVWEVPYIYWKAIPGYWTNHIKRTGRHSRRAGEWDHQITVNRGRQCSTACTRREREAETSQIGGRPARQALPHQEHVYRLSDVSPIQFKPYPIGDICSPYIFCYGLASAAGL